MRKRRAVSSQFSTTIYFRQIVFTSPLVSFTLLSSIIQRSFLLLHQRILQEQKCLTSEIIKLEKQLKSFPDGKLICCNHGNICKWYQSDGKKEFIFPKPKRHLQNNSLLKDICPVSWLIFLGKRKPLTLI